MMMTKPSSDNQLTALPDRETALQESLHSRHSLGLNQLTLDKAEESSHQQLEASQDSKYSSYGHFSVSTAPMLLEKSESSLIHDDKRTLGMNDSLTLDQIWQSGIVEDDDHAGEEHVGATAGPDGAAIGAAGVSQKPVDSSALSAILPNLPHQQKDIGERLEVMSQSAPQLSGDEHSFDFSEVDWINDVGITSKQLGRKLEQLPKSSAADISGMASHRSPKPSEKTNGLVQPRKRKPRAFHESDTNLAARAEDSPYNRIPHSARTGNDRVRRKIKLKASDLGFTSLKTIGPGALQEAVAKWKEENGYGGVVKSVKVQPVQGKQDEKTSVIQSSSPLEEKLAPPELENSSDDKSRARSICSEKTIKRSNSATRSNTRRSKLEKQGPRPSGPSQRTAAKSSEEKTTMTTGLDGSLHGNETVSGAQAKIPKRSISNDVEHALVVETSTVGATVTSVTPILTPRENSRQSIDSCNETSIKEGQNMAAVTFHVIMPSPTGDKTGISRSSFESTVSTAPSMKVSSKFMKEQMTGVQHKPEVTSRQRSKSVTESSKKPRLQQASEVRGGRVPRQRAKSFANGKSRMLQNEAQDHSRRNLCSSTHKERVLQENHRSLSKRLDPYGLTKSEMDTIQQKCLDKNQSKTLPLLGSLQGLSPAQIIVAKDMAQSSSPSTKVLSNEGRLRRNERMNDLPQKRQPRPRGRSTGPVERKKQDSAFLRGEKKTRSASAGFSTQGKARSEFKELLAQNDDRGQMVNMSHTRQSLGFRSEVGDLLRSPFRAVKGAIRRVSTRGRPEASNDSSRSPATVLVDNPVQGKLSRARAKYLDDTASTDPTSGASIGDHRRFSDISLQTEDIKVKLGRAGVSDETVEALRRMGLVITDITRDG